ncbi:hypothetical protein SAMN05216188_102133 [Lentzea xinjiangensis]|uniref:Uncharacterized protein n=1 Tax=Lentzea xinjiangensis TaxID=402600 RepID=A0A1H9DH95_9PSEU|nr:hypothetical protein [Lentzea xinjiangensis]SEQ12118.1 hypothetical protein SAMN05216188_102133 [Lentzea xinjiangensis]
MKKFTGGKALAVVAVAGGAVLASIAPVMADVSAQSPSAGAIRVESPAKWKAWGAAIEVQLTYACPAGHQGHLNVTVNQAVLGGVAVGNTYKEITCTGGFETTAVNVTANERAFRWGSAFAKSELRTYQNGNAARDEREIQIVP